MPMWQALLFSCFAIAAEVPHVEHVCLGDLTISRGAGHSLLQVHSSWEVSDNALHDDTNHGLDDADPSFNKTATSALTRPAQLQDRAGRRTQNLQQSRQAGSPAPLPIDKPAATTNKHVAVFNDSDINDSIPENKSDGNDNKDDGSTARRETLKRIAQEANKTHRPEDERPDDQPKKTQNGTLNQSDRSEEKAERNRTKNLSKAMPFVKIHTNHSKETTTVEVYVASSHVIISVYLLLYMPILLLWVAYANDGLRETAYFVLLPATYCASGVGFDLVNQSLAILMNSPMSISMAQAVAMFVVLSAWAVMQECREGVVARLSREALVAIATWSIAALAFTAFQLVNHELYVSCSLSERLVFGSLCPACGTLAERLFLPVRLHSRSNLNSKLAQSMMTLGAIVFSIQYNSFSLRGMAAASMYVGCFVPLRILQRYLLTDGIEVPVYILSLLDAACMMLPAGFFSEMGLSGKGHTLETLWRGWLSDASIIVMLVLSFFTFIAMHVCSLTILRSNSATSFLVFQNIQNFGTVAMGIFCFGDHVLASPLASVALVICLLSSSWYAFELDGSNSKYGEPTAQTHS